MAYDGNKLSIIAATIEGVFNTGVLIGTDSINTVLTANYISDGQKRGLPLGCTVWYFDGTDVFDCFVSAVEAPPGFGVTLTQIGGGSGLDLLVDDADLNAVDHVDHLTFVGATVSGTTPHATVTIDFPPPAEAGIIPESGPTPIKISAFTHPSAIGIVGFATGLLPSGDDFINANFTQTQLLSGRPTTGDSVTGVAGSGTVGGGTGGDWSVTGGDADTTGYGGGVNLTGGYAHGTGKGGHVNLTAGNSYSAEGGSITLQSGFGYTTGGITIKTPNATTGAPSPGFADPINILGGGYYGGAGAVPADGTAILLRGGIASGVARQAGSVTLEGGAVSAASDVSQALAGAVNLYGGNSPGAYAGGPTFYTGAGGDINIAGGGGGVLASPSTQRGDGGHLFMSSGYGVGPTHVSGMVTLQAGEAGSGADGGPMYLLGAASPGTSSGPGYGGATGGLIEVRAGTGGNITTPSLGHGSGGVLHLYSGGGVGTGHKSGDIILRVGNVFDSAVLGSLFIRNLPTSAAGLSSGAVWNNSNVLTLVP